MPVWTPGYWFYSMYYNPFLAFLSLLSLFQIWSLGAPSRWFLCSFDMTLWFYLKQLLTCRHQDILGSSCAFPTPALNQPLADALTSDNKSSLVVWKHSENTPCGICYNISLCTSIEPRLWSFICSINYWLLSEIEFVAPIPWSGKNAPALTRR